MAMTSWKEMNEKYPEYRGDMNQQREREFVKDCYEVYEKQGFAKVFWSQQDDYLKYIGKKFKVIERVTESGADLECLPMWIIQFEDGSSVAAFTDEITPADMLANGCTLDILEIERGA